MIFRSHLVLRGRRHSPEQHARAVDDDQPFARRLLRKAVLDDAAQRLVWQHLFAPASPENLREIGPSVRGVLGRGGPDGPVNSFCFMERNVFGALEMSTVFAEHPDVYLGCIDAFMHLHRVPGHTPVRMDTEGDTAELIRPGMVARGVAECRRSNMVLSPARAAGHRVSVPDDLELCRFDPTMAVDIHSVQREAYGDQPDAHVSPELFMPAADPSRSNLGFAWSDVDAQLTPCLIGSEGLAAYCLVRSGPDGALVLDLAVRRKRARRGLGRFLFEEAIRRCAGAGLGKVELSVTTGGAAHRLYRSLGFRDATGFSFFRIGP